MSHENWRVYLILRLNCFR